ncbi:MAG TPA: winged helix-turn-helix transcriptional regulator [Thermomicrobiaceae bacterium]|nr:winged helix-turn-helix transcriptional regulator [Thermomicrobiaceae bacterium]
MKSTLSTSTAHEPPATVCPRFHHAVELIGRRWTGAILQGLLGGATRFTDIATTVPGLSDRLLSERLRELETEGIVTRTVIPDVPVRVEYRLTEKGRALTPVLAAVAAWAQEWIPLPAVEVATEHPRSIQTDS